MLIDRRQFIQASVAALAAGGAALPAAAQAPDAAKIILGFAPGGTIDLAGRRVADKLAPAYARTVIVENRTGAGGQIAVQSVKNAAPDGANVLLTPTSPMSLHLFTYRKLPYDPVADLHAGVGRRGVRLRARGRARWCRPRCARSPSSWRGARRTRRNANFGSAGQGSAAHFIGAALGLAWAAPTCATWPSAARSPRWPT